MNKRVLLIDDSEAFACLITHILNNKFEVAVARNGIEAFALLRSWNIPDLIICDINMPELDGIAFLSELQNSGLYNCIPVIVMTGDEMHQDSIVQDLQTRFVKKPFEPKELLAKIDELFAHVNVETV